MFEINVTDIEGFKLGHASDFEAGTGCTVVICEEGASAGVEVRGGAPGTRETDLLNPMEMVEKIHGVVLSGGSAFGLDASSGVMEYLEEHNIGFDVGITKVPIVCQAVLFDLTCGNPKIRPNKEMGYLACKNSELYSDNINGNIGCGTGATIGKFLGAEKSMKGGFGSYAIQVGNLKIGAIVGVNCLGDIIDPNTNKIIAGALKEDNSGFIDTEETMISLYDKKNNVFKGNTTIGTILTNANLTKAQANKIASMAHNGFGRTMRPAHTMFDGDTIFTMSTNKIDADINVVGLLSARVMEKAILNGVKSATSAYGYKSYNDISLK
ncbi:L-aminopeptidase/D-esterase [Clostridium cavendishii DSM 21758]|uniref:L-aminopeptidase/D-esterase n=1 Tax=Clostridium cavendishii DSM 21758 TaxID=1121302 RepID=A0A1M6CI49_9CLOT|nr:P1 family peptidase [Clostridium cavendishii]SHI60666.1 L-aminopeptidase/D-esterase [Clostridium cavendishii DSM 21758]